MSHAANRTGHPGLRGLVAVNDVSFELTETDITGLVGPNGSGKTTLFHLITGFYTLDRGNIYLEHKPISGLPPYRINRMGLVRTFQQTRILPFLSVLENLPAAVPQQAGEGLYSIFFRPGLVKREERANRHRALDILDLVKSLVQRARLLSFHPERGAYNQSRLTRRDRGASEDNIFRSQMQRPALRPASQGALRKTNRFSSNFPQLPQ